VLITVKEMLPRVSCTLVITRWTVLNEGGS